VLARVGVRGDGAWGGACGGFIWASAAGTRSGAPPVSATAANGNRRVLAVLRSVHCISFLPFSGARGAGPVTGSKADGRLIFVIFHRTALSDHQNETPTTVRRRQIGRH